MWDLSMFLSRFPKLEALGLESGDCITIGGRKKLVPLLSLNPVQKQYPLKSFFRPVGIEASQLLWLLIHCPKLSKLDLEDVLMDIDPENILKHPLMNRQELAKNLRHLRLRSMKNYALPQFGNLIKVFSHIKYLHVEIKEETFPPRRLNERCYLTSHWDALQSSSEEARAALKTIGVFFATCTKLQHVCIVDHLYDHSLLKLLTSEPFDFSTLMKGRERLPKVELHAGFPF